MASRYPSGSGHEALSIRAASARAPLAAAETPMYDLKATYAYCRGPSRLAHTGHCVDTSGTCLFMQRPRCSGAFSSI